MDYITIPLIVNTKSIISIVSIDIFSDSMFPKKTILFFQKKKRSCRSAQTVDKVIFKQRKGSGNKAVSRVESAGRIHFCRGKQRVSRHFCRWNSSVFSAVSTRRNPNFDEGCRLCRHPQRSCRSTYSWFLFIPQPLLQAPSLRGSLPAIPLQSLHYIWV